MSAHETRPVEKEALPIIHHMEYGSQQPSACSDEDGPLGNEYNHSGSY